MSLFGESPSNVAAGPLDCHDCRNRVKTIKEHTHTHPIENNLTQRFPEWVERLKVFPVTLFQPLYMMIRSVLFSTPSAAQRASRMSECVPLTRSLWGYYFPPFFLSLLILFHFSLFFVSWWTSERKHGHFQMVCVCHSGRPYSRLIAPLLLHLRSIWSGLIIVCVLQPSILTFLYPLSTSRGVATDLVRRR